MYQFKNNDKFAQEIEILLREILQKYDCNGIIILETKSDKGTQVETAMAAKPNDSIILNLTVAFLRKMGEGIDPTAEMINKIKIPNGN